MVVLGHQPARPLSCLAEAEAEGAGWSSRHHQVNQPSGRRRARARHARVTCSTGKPAHAARNARDDAREWFLACETTSSLAVAARSHSPPLAPHST